MCKYAADDWILMDTGGREAIIDHMQVGLHTCAGSSWLSLPWGGIMMLGSSKCILRFGIMM